LSVPPPGPAVATNSIGFCGCQAAWAGTTPANIIAAADSMSIELFIVSSGPLFLSSLAVDMFD
jgi:hypothetical protein